MKSIIKLIVLLLSVYGVYQLIIEGSYRLALAVEPREYKCDMESTFL